MILQLHSVAVVLTTNMFLYGFFDYKYDIVGFESDIFSTNHFIFLAFAIVALIFVAICAPYISHKKIDLYFKISAILLTCFEVTKVSWESYFDIVRGNNFNVGGILPFYTCSLLMYCSFVAGFGKGKAKEIALSWICTIGMVTGTIVLVYPNGLRYYPVWTFGGMHTLMYHFMLVCSATLALFSNYKRLTWKDVYISVIPMLMLAPIAITLNYVFKADYMQVYDASGVPIMSDLASKLASHNLRWIFTIIMFSTYFVLSAIVIAIYKLINIIKTKEVVSEKEIVRE